MVDQLDLSFLFIITLIRIVISTNAKGEKSPGDTLCNGVKFPARRGGVSRLSLRGTGVVLHDPHSMRTHSAFEVDSMFVRFRLRHLFMQNGQ